VLEEAGVDNLASKLDDIKFLDDYLKKNSGKTLEQVTSEIKNAPGGYKNWKNFDLEYNYREVEIVDATGSPLGEFDGIDVSRKAFIEDKSATGLNTINPRTGQPTQSPTQWAEKQIHNKTVTRIENLNNNVVATRPTTGGSSNVPSLGEIKDYKTLHFRLDSSEPSLIQAVEQQLTNLKNKYPLWEFTAQYGGK
jgi:hypothetical protein